MKIYAERIRQLRKDRGISQARLAELLGVSRSAIGMYETGSREPSLDMCEAIADIFNVDMNYLTGSSDLERRIGLSPFPANLLPVPGTYRVPILGTIACGAPILAEENLAGYAEVPDLIECDFTLYCRGDSMVGARIHDGDLVYIRAQPEVENGQIAAVLIEEEATLKRFYASGKIVTLAAANPGYPPIVVDTAREPLRVLGLAVGFTSKLLRGK